MVTLGENIRARRKALGMTQAQLADMLGYSDKSAITHIEKGTVNLSISKIYEFADALQTTANALIGDKNTPSHAENTIEDGLLSEILELGKQMDSYHLEKYLEWGKKILESQKMIGE